MSYAVVSDVAVRLGRPITDPLEVGQVNAWIGDVEAEISAGFARSGLNLGTQVSLGDPSLATVVRIESDVVIRRIYRPQPGRTSTSRTVDDGTVTDRWEASSYDDGLTAAEWELLLPTVSTGAFSTRPGFEPDLSAPVWP